MRGNLPIEQLTDGQDVWLVVSVSDVCSGVTKNGRRYYEATARNATGRVRLKVWAETIEKCGELRCGLFGVTGALSTYRDQRQFVVTSYSPIDAATYSAHQPGTTPVPRAFTFDLECVPQARYLERVREQLRASYDRGGMAAELRSAYEHDPVREEQRVFLEGALYGATAEIVAMAVHVGPQAEFVGAGPCGGEYVFGITADGKPEGERKILESFTALLKGDLDPETPAFEVGTDELVTFCGRTYDYPVYLQRAAANGIETPRLVDLSAYRPAGLYDAHRHWLAGAKPGRSKLDDLAWALGLESSKEGGIDGSKVFSLYSEGEFAAIRNYVMADVTLTRRLYELLIGAFGR